MKIPHDQAVLLIPIFALYTYPDPGNHHLNVQKVIREVFLPVSGTGKLQANNLHCFKQQLLSSG
jgi:hypothetical protein